MINSKTNLKHRLMAVRFAIWDLHLYLDTHMGDCTAMELIEEYKKKYEPYCRNISVSTAPSQQKEKKAKNGYAHPFRGLTRGVITDVSI